MTAAAAAVFAAFSGLGWALVILLLIVLLVGVAR